MQKRITTKDELDLCKLVANFACEKAFIVDEFKLVASFHNVDVNSFRRANAVFNFRLNNGLNHNPYSKDDNMFSVYELLFQENRVNYHNQLMEFLQVDVQKEKFQYVRYYKDGSDEIISAYKEVANNPTLYPEALL